LSWAEVQRQRRESQPSQGKNDIGRSVKSILNKLTVEKFDELCTKLMQCGFCTQAHVQMLVRAILEEAQLSRSQSGVYADLCVRLIKEFGDAEYLIKRVLRIECRQRFEHYLQCFSPAALTQVLDEEAEQEALLARKIRFLGHVRFMGQLLTRGILSHQELFSCTVDLLKRPLQSSSVEALSVLLGVVGPTFDTDTWPQRSKLQTIFVMLSDLLTDPEVSTRVRYLVRDPLELRDSGWVDRKQATRVELPKRLDEVRHDAEQAQNMRAGRHSQERRAATGRRGEAEVRHFGAAARETRTAKSSAETQEPPGGGEAPRRRRRRGGERERRRRQR
jgi:translation initiation factor 4G